ncbi:MAG: hypothetical protein QME96_09735, partial [Myxococcota bacterium]|nr:hypothetical protein [Myxococcota bacterium]
PGGSGGCLELAWCLVSSGCASQEACVDQGLCYQDCFGAARPEVAGAARDLLVCVVGVCAAQCATGITTTECISCLGLRCLPTLRACIGL